MKINITSKKSVYDYTYTKGEDLKHRGFDYKDKLFNKSLSSHMYKNDNVIGFLSFLDSIFYEYIESVKKIRVFNNFTVDKNYKKIP
jgi:hypothetical protein